MPYARGRFLGLSVRSITANIGRAGQTSQLTVGLALDPVNGDGVTTTVADYGKPFSFEFYNFRFAGLLQKFSQKNDSGGFPIYEAVLIDPREILEGAQLILGGYSGTTAGTPNLFNIYGFWENQSYGGSLEGEGGIPWHRIRDGLLAICNQPSQTTYGGPLTFRDVNYSLDLSELPEPPLEYRLGGGNIGLLEAITQICDDGGYDFFVTLEGYTIKVKTISLIEEPPLGTITSLVNSNDGTVVRSESGVEIRNEVTASFLVGGEISTLHLTDSIRQFWGLDFDGNPILDYEELYLWTPYFSDDRGDRLLTPDDIEKPAGVFSSTEPIRRLVLYEGFERVWRFERGSEVHYRMYLNAAPVADIIGSVSYECTTIEMRLAQVNYNSWAAWVQSNRPEMANIIQLIAPVQAAQNVVGGVLRPNIINDDPANARRIAIFQSTVFSNCQRMYEFVKGYADEYMGRKFLVYVPFVSYKQDDETLKISTSYEISEAGYLPDGSSPLGLSLLNQDVFETQDGRLRCFVRYDNLEGVDFAAISPQGSATDVENSKLFVEAQVAPNFIYAPGPCVELTISGALKDRAVDIFGDMSLAAAVLHQNEETFKRVAGLPGFGNAGVKIAPATRPPAAVAVPLKSNTLTYGPWYARGAAGKVKFEQDTTLVPWNYGGYANLDLAGGARVISGLSNMQLSEAGSIELAAPPIASLGETLQTGSPNITNIDVSVGANGVTTTYRFQTYTQRPYIFGKGGFERFKRLANANQEVKKATRLALKQANERGATIGDASRTARAQKKFDEDAAKAIKKQSPHDVILGYNHYDETDDIVRVGVSSADMDEALGGLNADNDDSYQSTSLMSLNGLLRPFSTVANESHLPSYISPHFTNANSPNGTSLNPWKGQNDIEFYAYGESYSGVNALARSGDNTKARPMALRGPLVVAGWGFDIEGRPVPGTNGAFDENYLKRSDNWKVGPVDLNWDSKRGVWTSHDVLKGYASKIITANGSGQMFVQGPGSGWYMNVYNWFSTAVASGIKVMASYVCTDNKWYVTSADCGSPSFTPP